MIMARRPGTAHEDLQALKQANACIVRAIELLNKEDGKLSEKEAIAQAQLAWRFLDDFVDRRG